MQRIWSGSGTIGVRLGTTINASFVSSGETLSEAWKPARGGPSGRRWPWERIGEEFQEPGLAWKSPQDSPPATFPGGGAGFYAEDDELPGGSINLPMAPVASVGKIVGRWQELLTPCPLEQL
jgi:hypothetical protein